MPGLYQFVFINHKIVYVDIDYTAIDPKIKNLDLQGQKIDISDMSKGHIASRLYQNLSGCEDSYEISEMLFWLRPGYTLNSFKYVNLNIDLSKDSFDPTLYDKCNNTYTRDNVLTAQQCVQKLKRDIEYSRIIRDEANLAVQKFLNRTDFKMKFDGNEIKIYFSKEQDFSELIKIADVFKEKNLKAYPYRAWTYKTPVEPSHILIQDDYDVILQNLSVMEVNNVNKLACS